MTIQTILLSHYLTRRTLLIFVIYSLSSHCTVHYALFIHCVHHPPLLAWMFVSLDFNWPCCFLIYFDHFTASLAPQSLTVTLALFITTRTLQSRHYASHSTVIRILTLSHTASPASTHFYLSTHPGSNSSSLWALYHISTVFDAPVIVARSRPPSNLYYPCIHITFLRKHCTVLEHHPADYSGPHTTVPSLHPHPGSRIRILASHLNSPRILSPYLTRHTIVGTLPSTAVSRTLLPHTYIPALAAQLTTTQASFWQ